MKKKLKELNDIDNYNTKKKEDYNKNIYSKIKSYTYYNNKFEKSEKNFLEEKKDSLLNQLIMPKATNNTEIEKDIEKESIIGDFQNYESKYPRLPTSNELNYFLNSSKNLKTNNLAFKNIKKRIFENDKKDINSRNNYLETDINIENSKLNMDNEKIKENKQYIVNITVGNNDITQRNINKEANIYKTYRPLISKKYDINNRFKNF